MTVSTSTLPSGTDPDLRKSVEKQPAEVRKVLELALNAAEVVRAPANYDVENIVGKLCKSWEEQLGKAQEKLDDLDGLVQARILKLRKNNAKIVGDMRDRSKSMQEAIESVGVGMVAMGGDERFKNEWKQRAKRTAEMSKTLANSTEYYYEIAAALAYPPWLRAAGRQLAKAKHSLFKAKIKLALLSVSFFGVALAIFVGLSLLEGTTSDIVTGVTHSAYAFLVALPTFFILEHFIGGGLEERRRKVFSSYVTEFYHGFLLQIFLRKLLEGRAEEIRLQNDTTPN